MSKLWTDANVFWIYRLNENMIMAPQQNPEHGTPLGATFIWPLTLQPAKVEWIAEVAYFIDDAKQVYFVCDIVHRGLAERVLEDQHSGMLALENQISKAEAIAQAKAAQNALRQICLAAGCSVITKSTLGATSIVDGAAANINFFYALEGQTISPIVQSAMQFDPRI